MTRPYTAFNFAVSILLGDGSTDPLCDAAFAECSGLEVTHEVTTIREGGSNNRPIHLRGPVSYGTLALQRGMTADIGLWRWMDRVTRDDGAHLRATCQVDLLASDRSATVATFVLRGCVPTKLTAPTLDAQSGLVALEELELAYELLTLEPVTGGGAGA